MRYLTIELNGFKRFRLHQTRAFRMTMTEMLQLILGTNGSGKSSLVEQITMLPPEKKDFYTDGSKVITGEENGWHYTATATFNPHPKYSLIKHGAGEGGEDLELNPGGTRDAQLKMCLQEFRQTPEIHKLILGKQRFTRMGPPKRREWMMRLSNNNYDYALQVYKKLKDTTNEITGTLRRTTKRLGEESAKSITETEKVRLQEEVDQLYRDLNLLMENRAPLVKPVQNYQDEQDRMLSELHALSSKLSKLRFVQPEGYRIGVIEENDWGFTLRHTITSIEDIDEVLSNIRSEIAARDALINMAMKNHAKYDEQLQILTKTGEADIATLHERRKASMARYIDMLSTRILTNTSMELDKIPGEHGLSALESLSETLMDIFMTIPENTDRKYSLVNLRSIEEKIFAKQSERAGIVQELNRYQGRKSHADAHKNGNEVTCPKCHHHWVAGYNEEEYARLLVVIAETEEKIKACDKAISALQEDAQANREYGDKYRSFVRLTQSWDVLRPFWTYLTDENFIIDKPRMVLPIIEHLRHDLKIVVAADSLYREVEEITNLIKSAEQLGDANLTDVKVLLEEWSHEVEKLTGERNELQRALTDYTQYHRQMLEGIELDKRIAQLQGNVVKVNEEMIEMIRRETIQHCIRQLQTTLSRKEEVLSYISHQKALIADMEEQIRLLTIQEEAGKLAVRELSPTEGLIAEGLLGFIQHFVSEVNAIIQNIWSYPLVVHDCALESVNGVAELDYKFPVTVNNDPEDPLDDIDEGSTGIMEVIDLAFKIESMRCLGLENSPLYLDEFGASFDAAHQIAATHTINNLMEEGRFTQLFMVSHYESSYGALTNAEVCVLCPSNITVPVSAKYNQHVTLH